MGVHVDSPARTDGSVLPEDELLGFLADGHVAELWKDSAAAAGCIAGRASVRVAPDAVRKLLAASLVGLADTAAEDERPRPGSPLRSRFGWVWPPRATSMSWQIGCGASGAAASVLAYWLLCC